MTAWLMHGCRVLWRQRGSSLLAVIALALGLGANTGLFTLVHASLFRALPFADEERIVSIWETNSEDRLASGAVAPGDIRAWSRELASFSAVTAFRPASFNALVGDEPERLVGAVVTPTFFRVFAIQPVAGRVIDPSAPSSPRETVISEALWKGRFGGRADVVGSIVQLGGEPALVVGVAPSDFEVPARSELWVAGKYWVPENPLHPDLDVSWSRTSHYLLAAGKLRPGTLASAAQAELDLFASRLASTDPGLGFRLVPFREDQVGTLRPTLLLLWGAVGFVLLLACSNVAALLLGQSIRRRNELAIRMALGATRGQLLKMHLAEGFVVSGLGALLACALALLVAPLLVVLGPPGLNLHALRLDAAVLGFTAFLALGSTLAISVLPALTADTRPDLVRSTGGSRPAAGLRNLLVTGEVTLAILLLVSAGLLARSFWKLGQTNPGFQASGRVAGVVALPPTRYSSVEAQLAFLSRLSAELDSRPEISDYAYSSHVPLAPGNLSRAVEIPGRPEPGEADLRVVSSGYFRTLAIPLLAGRTFEDHEQRPNAGAAMVNAAFARQFLSGLDPIGRTVTFGIPRRIVGVVGDVLHAGLDRPARPEVYLPIGSEPWPTLNVLVRGPVPDAGLAAALLKAVRAVDAQQAIGRLGPVSDIVVGSVANRRRAAELLGLVALLALILAVTGIYGVMAHATAQRIREMGVRLAMGATPLRLLGMVVRQSMKPVAVGICLGIGAALLAGRLLQQFLYVVQPGDPLTLGGVAGALALVALATCTVVAWRAASVDPAVALQGE